MALTNQQYESIMQGYELTRTKNRHILEERQEKILQDIPDYGKLSTMTGSLARDCTKKLLDGDARAAADLKERLLALSDKKRLLLMQHGYPADYLEPVYTCPYCHDTGFLPSVYERPSAPFSGTATQSGQGELSGEAGTVREKCRCFRQKEISLLYEQSNIRKIIEKENFSTLSMEYYEGEDRKRFQEAVKISLDFVQNFEHDYHNLLFYGTVGTGKSFLSGCIAKELLQAGRPVLYFSSAGLFDILARYSFDSKSKEALVSFCGDLYGCDLVIIDDLGTEITNAFVTSQLFACLNERALRRKATIISTNLGLEELRDRYSDRIFSRITSNFTICKLSGPDIRLYRKRMRK